jgi:hypothetical protein
MSEDIKPEQIRVKDESNDKKYFTITPRIVKAYARNPPDLALWETVKDITGENGGECFLNTDQLAVLAGCSAGQVSNSRKYWLKIGFLKGEIKKDEGFSQAVWHLTIPDLWKLNIEWCEKYPKIEERINFRLAHKSLHRVKASGSEGKPSPGETKNNAFKKKKDMEADASERPDPFNTFLGFERLKHEHAQREGMSQDVIAAIESYPVDCQTGARLMFQRHNLIPPTKPKSGKGGDFADWINGIRDLVKLCAEYNVTLEIGFDEFWKVWNPKPFPFDRPGSMVKVMRSALAVNGIRETPAPEFSPIPDTVGVPNPNRERPKFLQPRTI